MMILSTMAAAVINSRQTRTQLQTWQRHAGANIAVQAGPMRWCFRIDESGEWRGVSPLVSADAEVTWVEGKMHIRGDGALLQDLQEMWKQHSPQQLLSDMIGEDAAAQACDMVNRAASCVDIRDAATALNFAPSKEDVSAFCQQCATLSKKIQALSVRVSGL